MYGMDLASLTSYPQDTYTGFRALGFNSLISLVSVLAFHVLHVGPPTQDRWLPDLRFPVSVERIARAKHGSCVSSLPGGAADGLEESADNDLGGLID
jgi:hypothetical protein